MKLEIEGVDALKAELTRLGLDFDEVAGDVTLETATHIGSDVKRAVSKGTPSGRTYKRGKRAVHTASAPGHAPASDTGRLVGSIYAERDGKRSALAGSPLAYAHYLEHGTRRMAPRPVWLKTVKKNEKTMKEAFEARIRGLIT